MNIGPDPGQDKAGYEIELVGSNGPLWIGPDGKSSRAAAPQQLLADHIEGGAHGTHAADGNGGFAMHGNVVSDFVGEGFAHFEWEGDCVVGPDSDRFQVTGFFVTATVP